MAKVIFHVDLNSFFASAETLYKPELADKPLIVAHDGPRSVVSTANYKAREYGIKSGMAVSMAKRLCKDLVIVEHHFNLYKQYSNHFMDILKRYTPIVQQVSIDEAFCDMSETIKHYQKPLDLAVSLQDSVKQNCGLDCSIGIGPNKFLAKMASDMKKPRGITVLRKKDVPFKLWPLPIEDMMFIGKKTAPLLKEIGINTIGDLANYNDIDKLSLILGSSCESVIARAWGNGSDTFEESEDVQSMSQVTTLTTSLRTYEEVLPVLRSVATSLSNRLYRNDKMGYCIGITIRNDDFKTTNKQIRLDSPIYKSDDLFTNALSIFDTFDNVYPIRLIGIFVSKLDSIHHGNVQLNLFNDYINQPMQTKDLVDQLNKQLNKGGSIQLASTLLKKEKK